MDMPRKTSTPGIIVYWPQRRGQPYTIWYRDRVIGFRSTEREALDLLKAAPSSRLGKGEILLPDPRSGEPGPATEGKEE